MRIVFFGTGSDYSISALDQLMRHSEVVAVVLPAASGSRTRLTRRLILRYASRRIRRIASAGGVTVLEYTGGPSTEDALRSLRPDLVVVASFPSRLTAGIRGIARLGAVNIHPSLLPAHRGADPLFWSYFENEASTGVTLHWMDEGLDTGDIIAQETVTIPRGSAARSLAVTIAQAGARLLIAALPAIADGTAPRRAQEGGEADPLPSRAAWVTAWHEWPAERLWHFLRGVGAAHGHRLVGRDGRNTPTGQAVSWKPGTPGAPPGSIEVTRGMVRIACVDGFVTALRPPLLLRLVRYGRLIRQLLGRGRR